MVNQYYELMLGGETVVKVINANRKSTRNIELIIKAALGKPLSLFGFLRSIIERMKAVIIKTINQVPKIKLIFKALTKLLNSPPDMIFNAAGRRESMQITKDRIPSFEYFRVPFVWVLLSIDSILHLQDFDLIIL
jgi:hypothetical protein